MTTESIAVRQQANAATKAAPRMQVPTALDYILDLYLVSPTRS